jgi:hypothetical protein
MAYHTFFGTRYKHNSLILNKFKSPCFSSFSWTDTTVQSILYLCFIRHNNLDYYEKEASTIQVGDIVWSCNLVREHKIDFKGSKSKDYLTYVHKFIDLAATTFNFINHGYNSEFDAFVFEVPIQDDKIMSSTVALETLTVLRYINEKALALKHLVRLHEQYPELNIRELLGLQLHIAPSDWPVEDTDYLQQTTTDIYGGHGLLQGINKYARQVVPELVDTLKFGDEELQDAMLVLNKPENRNSIKYIHKIWGIALGIGKVNLYRDALTYV